MEFDIEKCYKTSLEIVLKATEIVKKGFESVKKVETKSASYDLVTDYDRMTEQFLIENISDAFPGHRFISEEMKEKDSYTDNPTWIIDPIDGTVNFVHGDPNCVISVGLAVNKEIVIGIISNPCTNQIFTAVKGQGAFLNNKPIKTSKTEEMKDAVIGLEISIATFPKCFDLYVNKYKSCIKQAQGMRSIGCAAMSLCMVAMGAWDGYHVEQLFPWDVAAGSLIISEAGGTVLDKDGGKFDCMKGDIICAGTNGLANKLVNVFKP